MLRTSASAMMVPTAASPVAYTSTQTSAATRGAANVARRLSSADAPPLSIDATATAEPARRPAAAGLPAEWPDPAAATPERKPRRSEEIRLEIESLKYYEMIQPIPVVVRRLGERAYEAEAPDLDLATTGASIMGAFLAMKEQIVAVFDRYGARRILNPEQQRQLTALRRYIGGPRLSRYAG